MQVQSTLLALITLQLLAATSGAQVTEVWTAKPGGTVAVSVASDASGIYATGTTLNDAAHGFKYHVLTVKYDIDGNLLWKQEYPSPLDGFEQVPSWLALDPAGNVLFTGRDFNDMLTLKYAPDGTLLWDRIHEGAYAGVRVAADAAGNVYVTGPSTNVASSRDYVTVKYDADGQELWTRTYDGPNQFDDDPRSLAVTAAGDVAITGQSTGGVTSFDLATVRYDTDGNELWIRRYNNAAEDGLDYGRSVAFGPGGQVYVAGASFGGPAPGGSGFDAVLVAYDAAGNELWVNRYDGPAGKHDEGHRVAVDVAGDVILSAEAQEMDLTPAFATVKYDPAGLELWAQTHVSDGGFANIPRALAIGTDGGIYVTGDGGDGQQDYLTVKYDAAGAEQWAIHYVDPDPQHDAANSIALLPDGDVVVVGGIPFTTVLYSQGIPSSEVVRVGFPPNPAALLPGVTSGPVLGATWDPVIDHSLLPAGTPASLDLLGVTWSPLDPGVPASIWGTLLCDPSSLIGVQKSPSGSAFQILLPDSLALAGVSLCTQGAAVDVSSASVVLTNALDITIGTF